MSTAFPQGGRSIVERLCAKFPELHVNDDEKQSELTGKIAEQFAHTYGDDWGRKRRSSTAPIGKDALAKRTSPSAFDVFDLFQGNATADILVSDGMEPPHPNVTDQEFVPVEPFNWLELSTPEPPIDNPTPPIVNDEQFKELRMLLATALVSLEELKAHQIISNELLTQMQLRHDPVPIVAEVKGLVTTLREDIRTLEVKGGVLFQTVTLRNPRAQS